MIYPVNRQNVVRKKQKNSESSTYQNLEPRRLLAGDLATDAGIGLTSTPQLVYQLSETVPVQQRFDLLGDHLRMEEGDRFRLIDIQRDHLGFAHMKYQQFHNRVEVEGGTYSVHVKDREIVSVSGDYIRVGDQSVAKSQLTEQAALGFALTDINATTYAWSDSIPGQADFHLHENDSEQIHLGDETHSHESFEIPTGKLVYVSQDDGEPVLAYKFDIYAIQPLSRNYVFVDAINGEIVEKYNRIHEVDAAATGTSLYNGTVDFVADLDLGSYRLRQAVNGVETFDLNNNTQYNTAVDITSATNSFTDPTVQTGVQAHFGTEKTLDYFFTAHGRDSYDGLGTTLFSYVSYGVNYVNAFWNGSAMTYGDGNGVTYSPLVSLDIVGHEIAHGVTQYTANLIYQNESGALNESFSDVFGETVENYALGGNPGDNDWLMGDDIGINQSGAFRNMADPNAKGDPDTYLGDFWYSGTGDSGGVHTNSGVQNKWFYILTEGEAGTNDHGFVYNVTGIGMADAAEIAYRNLSVYLTQNSQYADARVGAVQSAIDLFGYGSQQHTSTADAWDAVGVYEPIIELDFKPIAPNGSVIYQDSDVGSISGPGDVETIPLFIDPGQTVSVVVEGSGGLIPTIEILSPFTVPIGSSVGTTSSTILDSVQVPTLGGEYTVIISGEGNTVGDFDVQITLNAGIEAESYGGLANDTLIDAQDINGTAIALGDTGADRLAVIGGVESTGLVFGSEDFESGTYTSQWTTTSSSANGRNEVTDLFGAANGVYALVMDTLVNGSYNLNEAIWTLDLSGLTDANLSFNHAEWADETNILPAQFTGSALGDGVSISEDGNTWHTVLTNTSSAAGQWVFVDIDLASAAAAAGLTFGPEFKIKFQQYDNFAIADDGRAYDDVIISTPSSVEDWYSFDLLANQSTTISLEKYDGATGLLVELYDATETLLLTGVPGDNAESYIADFTNTGADGTFYVRISGASAQYSLLATRDAKFDIEPNDILNPIDLTDSNGALGYVATNPLIYLEPDDFPAEAVLDTAFSGVTFSENVASGSIYAAVANYTAPTGTQVFARTTTASNGFRFGDFELRADFDSPQTLVSIDVGSDDGSDVGVFRAYDAADTLLVEMISSPLSSGQSETLTIERVAGDISYVIAAGLGTDITPMDNLVYQSDVVDEDFYTIDVATPKQIDLTAFLPGLGPYQFENGLDQSSGSELRIELTDPNGTVVATDANSISYGSSLLGTYEVRVFANSDAGEYYLQNSLTQYHPGGIDFGPDGSPVVPGFIQVSDPAYTPQLGYGWTQSNLLSLVIGQIGNNLAKDKVVMRDGTFVVDVENGSYDVQLYYGVVRRSTPGDITIEGITNRFRPTFGTNTSVIYQTVVNDGQLTLEFDGTPALDNRIRIAGIRLTATQPAKFAGVEAGGKGTSLHNAWKNSGAGTKALIPSGSDSKADFYTATPVESNLVLQGDYKFELPEPTKFDSVFESFENNKDNFFENLSDEIGILV